MDVPQEPTIFNGYTGDKNEGVLELVSDRFDEEEEKVPQNPASKEEFNNMLAGIREILPNKFAKPYST